MQEPSSYISSLVDRAVKAGIPDPEPKRRRGKAAREMERRRARIISARRPSDDSDFDDFYINENLWNRMYKHEDTEYDQHIFNVFRQDKIETQERKVNVTTAICVRDCPEKAEEIEMWTKHVKAVMSYAPKKQRELEKQAKKEMVVKMLAKAVREMKRNRAAVGDKTSGRGGKTRKNKA